MGVQHTPGPWAYSWESESQDWAIVTDGSGRIVANVNTETGPDVHSAPATRPMPAEANARLIAAAPDLLNELEASAKMLRTLVEVAEDIRLEGAPIIRERLVSVEAAIARARGEQA